MRISIELETYTREQCIDDASLLDTLADAMRATAKTKPRAEVALNQLTATAVGVQTPDPDPADEEMAFDGDVSDNPDLLEASAELAAKAAARSERAKKAAATRKANKAAAAKGGEAITAVANLPTSDNDGYLPVDEDIRPTFAELRVWVGRVSTERSHEEALALLGEYGAKKISEVPDTDWSALALKCSKLLGQSDNG